MKQEKNINFSLVHESKACIPTDPEMFKGLNLFADGCCAFKKCCKKYKKGKHCRRCPKL